MFELARTENTILTLSFKRREKVRRDANTIEDFLADYAKTHSETIYGPPQILPVPDEFDPRVPRIVFGSSHGYSQLLVSQLSVSLQVTYSPDWQTDDAKRRSYVIERADLLWKIIEVLKIPEVSYSGLTNVTRAQTLADDSKLIRWFRNRLRVDLGSSHPLYTLSVRSAEEIDGRFYSNFTCENYRMWSLDTAIGEDARLPNKDVVDRGVAILGEFNDRLAWNEKSDYSSNRETTRQVIDKGFYEMARMVRHLGLNDTHQGETNERI